MTANKSRLATTLAELEKEYPGVAKEGSSGNLEAISTGVLSVDMALGCGGFPRGRICEIFGPPSHGKTSLLLRTIATAQRRMFVASYVDAEFCFLSGWAKAQGVDTEKLILVKPNYGEEALNVIEKLISDGIDLVVVDSVEGLVPRATIEGSMEDNHMGVKARMMSQALGKLIGIVSRSNSCLLFINQMRMKIGVMFGSPETTGGGEALKFWSSVRMRVSKKESIKEGEVQVGIRAQAAIVKNKVAPAFTKAEFDIYSGKCVCHGAGIDVVGDLLDMGVASGVVEKSGAWYSYEGQKIGQGRTAAAAFLGENPQVAEVIRFAILKLNSPEGENKK